MLKVIFYSLFLVVSCSKKLNQTDNQHDEVLKLLNRGAAQEALDLIQSRKASSPNDPTLRIYEASAHTLLAGVDIYALFPLLEMKFFREPIIAWDNLDRYENPYLKWVEDEELDEDDETDKDSQAANGSDGESGSESDGESENGEGESENPFLGEDNKLGDKYKALIMNALWGIYESIPVLINVPSVKGPQKDHINTALSLLLDPEFQFENKDRDRHYYVTFICAVMIASELGLVVDLSEVKSTDDLVCNISSNYLVDEYKDMRTYVEHGLLSLEKTDLLKEEEEKKNLAELTSFIQSAPSDLTDAQKQSIAMSLFKTKAADCKNPRL